MVAQVKRGIVDFIGAARPSIADPFLPKKIEEGRPEDIRECIGCNVCYSGDGQSVPIRCTQNPTMNEEWRRGWHPEKIAQKGSDATVLIVGAGPAGLEAARALGERGYAVMLAEAGRELGGRVAAESRLPGLGEWLRVRDYRVGQIERMPNVEVYRESKLGPEDVLATGAEHVAIATGAVWRRDGFGRSHASGIVNLGPADRIFTPDDIMTGRLPEGKTVLFDDDHYYMGAVIAERLRAEGRPVTLVTPESKVAIWGVYTAEQVRTQRRLLELGVEIIASHLLTAFDGTKASLACAYTGREHRIDADSLLLVTARQPKDELYRALDGRMKSLRPIGDCDAPAIIAAAVYAGHRYARELDEPDRDFDQVPVDRVFDETI
jgi:dimethylamine/trimethylamine dehydrogenase